MTHSNNTFRTCNEYSLPLPFSLHLLIHYLYLPYNPLYPLPSFSLIFFCLSAFVFEGISSGSCEKQKPNFKMQVPVIHHRLNNLFNFLQKQNLTFLSQAQPASIALSLCKWGALFLALLATFRTVLVIRFRQNASSLASIPLLIDDDDFSDDDDDGSCSTSSSSSEFEYDDEDEEEEENRTGDYFRVRGSDNGDGGFLRCRSIGDIFSLSEIANSKSVVKLWDTIGHGLGFGFDHSCSSEGGVVSVYGEEQSASPAVVVSAGESASGNLALRIWDTRLRRRIPAVIAEWGPTVGTESGGALKDCVRDDGRYGLTVGDVRNVRSPLTDETESHLDLWWPNSVGLKI